MNLKCIHGYIFFFKKGEGAIIMDNYYIYIYIYIYIFYRKDNSYIDINLVSTDLKKKIGGGGGGWWRGEAPLGPN